MLERYPPSQKIASPDELRRKYESARKEIADYKEAAARANKGIQLIAADKNKYKKEADVAKKDVLTLTKKQKAAGEVAKSTMWSGSAAIFVTIIYETWKITGFPGGHRWMPWWEHEAIYGVMVWFATFAFAQFYKMSKD
tara:strand:+ start:24 stop:440 length:417 start_codon:yes stop_codon:yes gene_type:complete